MVLDQDALEGLIAGGASRVAAVFGGLIFALAPETALGSYSMRVSLPGSNFPLPTTYAYLSWIYLPASIPLAANARVAVVLGSTGTCTVYQMHPIASAYDDYAGGDGYSGTYDGSTYTWNARGVMTPDRPDWPFQTMVEPAASVIFAPEARAQSSTRSAPSSAAPPAR